MATIVFNHVGGKPPFFDGTSSFDYWKRKMKMYLGSIHDKIWEVTEKEFIILDPTSLTPREQENKQCNTMALNTIYNGIDSKVFEVIKDLDRASEVWTRLEETYEGTSTVKNAKLFMLKDKLAKFEMKEDETIPEMFYRLQVIINDLKSLGEKVKDEDFCHKFLMCLPKRFKTLRTIIFRGGLKDVSPNEVLGDVMTEDQYNDDSDKEEKKEVEKKKDKSVAFKATSSKSKGKKKIESSDDSDDSSNEDDDEKMALFVKKFGKFMMKKGYRTSRKKQFKNKDEPRRCFKCNSKDHLVADCPYNSDNEKKDDKHKKKKEDKKEKKERFTYKKKGKSYVATWDSDLSSSSDDESDDDNSKSKKKTLANIALNNDKPSLFDSPSCFMAKSTKVQCGDDSSDSESDDEDEITKDELIQMLEDAREHFGISRKECKELRKSNKALEQELDDLKATHERLKEAHEKLQRDHTRLDQAHSSLVSKSEQVILSCDVGITCDLIDESFHEPIIVAPSNATSCSSMPSTSSGNFSHDATLIVENDNLKKEVHELIRALGNAYGGDARLLKCLGSQRFSLNKEGLGYTPKKGKAAFATHKPSFVKSNGRFCNRCKQVGHLEHNCNKMNKNKKNANAHSICFDSCYLLTKGENGVKAKFIGTPIVGSKKKAIWVPKSLVTNLQGPKQVWVPKKN